MCVGVCASGGGDMVVCERERESNRKRHSVFPLPVKVCNVLILIFNRIRITEHG